MQKWLENEAWHQGNLMDLYGVENIWLSFLELLPDEMSLLFFNLFVILVKFESMKNEPANGTDHVPAP